MRVVTDIFECNDISYDNVFASIHHDKVELQLESLGELGVVMLTKEQAREFARQLLEMCGDEND